VNKVTLLKSNRMLGAQLVECGLLPLRELETASARLMSLMASGEPHELSLLRILIIEMHTLDETRLLNHQIEHRNVSGISLGHYEVDRALSPDIEVEEMWETWTLPFDRVGGVWFLATAYYMSPFVRGYWADKLQAEIVWYVASMQELQAGIEALAADRLNAPPRRAVV